MPVPGTMAKYVSKSGGNAYHGSAYADFQSDAWEATNIDSSQIGRASPQPVLDVRQVNQLQRFRDATADLGGSKKNVAWWYGAYREPRFSSAIPGCSTLPQCSPQESGPEITYKPSSRHTLVATSSTRSSRIQATLSSAPPNLFRPPMRCRG